MIRMIPAFKYGEEDLKSSEKLAKQLGTLKEPDPKAQDKIAQINQQIIETNEAFEQAKVTNNTDLAWDLRNKLNRLNGQKEDFGTNRIRETDRLQGQLFELTNPAVEALSAALLTEIRRINELKFFEIGEEKKFDESKDPPVRLYDLRHNFYSIEKTIAFVMEAIKKIRGMTQNNLKDLDEVYRVTAEKIPLNFPLTDRTEARPAELANFREELNEMTPKLFASQRRYISFDYPSPFKTMPKDFED